jgi:hypothetical protein
MNTRAYLLYAECVKMGHGKFAGQIYKKYKDQFPGYKDSMDIFGFYAWHDPAADILEGVKYVREQMIAEGSYKPKGDMVVRYPLKENLLAIDAPKRKEQDLIPITADDMRKIAAAPKLEPFFQPVFSKLTRFQRLKRWLSDLFTSKGRK